MEIWKDIPEYKGLYQASNYGQIRNIKFGTRKPLVQFENRKKNSYLIVRLSKNGKVKVKLVHRLIGLTFIPNPENKPEINHKNLNKHINIPDNLEWCTHKENIHHAIKNGVYIGGVGRQINTKIANKRKKLYNKSKKFKRTGRPFKEKNGYRKCTKCKLTLSLDEFYLVYHKKVNKYWYHSRCKKCFQ